MEIPSKVDKVVGKLLVLVIVRRWHVAPRRRRVETRRRLHFRYCKDRRLEVGAFPFKVLDDFGDLRRPRVGDRVGPVVPQQGVGPGETVTAVAVDRRRAVLAVEQLVRQLVLLDQRVDFRVQCQSVDQSHVDGPRINVDVAVGTKPRVPLRLRQLQVVQAPQRHRRRIIRPVILLGTRRRRRSRTARATAIRIHQHVQVTRFITKIFVETREESAFGGAASCQKPRGLVERSRLRRWR